MTSVEHYNSNEKKLKRIITVIGILITSIFVCTELLKVSTKIDNNLNYIANVYSTQIENTIERFIGKTEVLKSVVWSLDGELSQEKFETLAKELYEKDKIQCIQYLPNGIVEYYYPKEGNEDSYGDNVLENPARKEDALLAVESKSYVVSGPYDLLQGNRGLIIRNPIFIDEEFIGFSVLILNLEEFLDLCELNQMENLGYSYELSYKKMNQDSVVVSQSKRELSNYYKVTKLISYANHTWELKVSPKFNLGHYGYCFAIAFIGLFITIYARKIVTDTIKKQKELDYNSKHDPLTKLYNRKMIEDFIVLEVQNNNQLNGIALLIDLDNFKKVNDERGHIEGDKVLKQIAEIINKNFKAYDIKVRLGGDEFMVYMPNPISIETLEQKIETFINNVRSDLKQYYEENKLSVSVGAVICNKDCNTYEKMYSMADVAMYVAKKSGKDGYYINKECNMCNRASCVNCKEKCDRRSKLFEIL